MPQSMPLSTQISKQSTRRTRHRTKAAQFGDGYSQRAADGLNSKVDTWSVSWEFLSSTDKDTVINALDAVGGWDYLTWTPPGEASSKKFIITPEGYSMRLVGSLYSVSVDLVQVFDL